LDAGKRKALARICGYFYKHRARMRYDEYLRHGYPIASGVIEGACRHLIKDRMERAACIGPWLAPKPCWTCAACGSVAHGTPSNRNASHAKRSGYIPTARWLLAKLSSPWLRSGGAVTPDFFTYLYLSGVTFFTLGYGDVTPKESSAVCWPWRKRVAALASWP
jgi:hypothetical protein